MPKKAKKVASSKKEPVKRLSDSKLYKLAVEAKEKQKTKLEATNDEGKLNTQIITELLLRDPPPKTMGAVVGGNKVNITLTQGTHWEYDTQRIWEILKPKQRTLVFERNIDLNKLPAAKRKEVLALLSEDEKAMVTTFTLNVEALSQAVQDAKIKATTIAPFSEEKKHKPYITVNVKAVE